jgi:hypothetical protein
VHGFVADVDVTEIRPTRCRDNHVGAAVCRDRGRTDTAEHRVDSRGEIQNEAEAFDRRQLEGNPLDVEPRRCGEFPRRTVVSELVDDGEAHRTAVRAADSREHSVQSRLVAAVVAVLVHDQHVTNRLLTHTPSVTVDDN